MTGAPIKFCGVGEKLGDIEPFHPERMASRILGMGDVLTLIEKAQENISEEQMKQMEKKFREASFTLDDYLMQFDQLAKMGSISDVLGMIPGANRLKIKDGDIDESQLARSKAIILSMTKQERAKPAIINGSRRKRIAEGSGTSIQEVNQLLKQFEQSKLMMKRMSGGRRGMKLPF